MITNENFTHGRWSSQTVSFLVHSLSLPPSLSLSLSLCALFVCYVLAHVWCVVIVLWCALCTFVCYSTCM